MLKSLTEGLRGFPIALLFPFGAFPRENPNLDELPTPTKNQRKSWGRRQPPKGIDFFRGGGNFIAVNPGVVNVGVFSSRRVRLATTIADFKLKLFGAFGPLVGTEKRLMGFSKTQTGQKNVLRDISYLPQSVFRNITLYLYHTITLYPAPRLFIITQIARAVFELFSQSMPLGGDITRANPTYPLVFFILSRWLLFYPSCKSSPFLNNPNPFPFFWHCVVLFPRHLHVRAEVWTAAARLHVGRGSRFSPPHFFATVLF